MVRLKHNHISSPSIFDQQLTGIDVILRIFQVSYYCYRIIKFVIIASIVVVSRNVTQRVTTTAIVSLHKPTRSNFVYFVNTIMNRQQADQRRRSLRLLQSPSRVQVHSMSTMDDEGRDHCITIQDTPTISPTETLYTPSKTKKRRHPNNIDGTIISPSSKLPFVTPSSTPSIPDTTGIVSSSSLLKSIQSVLPLSSDAPSSSSSGLYESMTPDPVSSSSLSYQIDDPVEDTEVKNTFIPHDNTYHDLHIPPAELRPSNTLITGQCFNWRVVITTDAACATTTDEMEKSPQKVSAWGYHNATEWIGTLRVCQGTETIIVMIRETPTTTLYRTLYTSNPSLDIKSILLSYFQITQSNTTVSDDMSATNDICLQDLYNNWSEQCERMKIITQCIPGVRILDQDPFVCMISFLCSSNNNIPRITKMISSIQRQYGNHICTISNDMLRCSDETSNIKKHIVGLETHDIDPITGNIKFYSFPSLNELYTRIESENDLRMKCGTGYRAKYIVQTLQLLHQLGGESYLHSLREQDNNPIYVQEQLLQFTGIGRKVADCIALFSLQQHTAIPVDVHVWNIARRDYNADQFIKYTSTKNTTSSKQKKDTNVAVTDSIEKTKSLTPTIYKQIGDIFRNKFPLYSGWAHSLLFVAELPSFRPILPNELVQDMIEFKVEEKAKKIANKQKRKTVDEPSEVVSMKPLI